MYVLSVAAFLMIMKEIMTKRPIYKRKALKTERESSFRTAERRLDESESRNKNVNTRDYISILKELVCNQKTVKIPVVGNSMAPFLITGRDYVLVQKPDCALKKGDVVLFQRESGDYILHRICKIRKGEVYAIGDAQTIKEGPIQRKQIVGFVIKAQRKGIWINETDLWWRFFQNVWIRIIPFRPFIRKLYGIIVVPHSHRIIDE